MGGISNLSAVALAHQLSATAGTNFSGGLQTYHGSLSGTNPPTGELINKLNYLKYFKCHSNIIKILHSHTVR